jgi:CheY-like chemotaxis protein
MTTTTNPLGALMRRIGGRPNRPGARRDGLGAALASAGAWYFELDAERLIRDVFPVPPAVRAALIGRDIRSFIDPLDPMGEHPRLARAFRGRVPFRDVVMPFDRGEGVRLLRVSGDPVHDDTGTFVGYRGLAIDASPAVPSTTVGRLASDLRHGLVNALGLTVGFARFLEQDLPRGGAQADYAARIRVAADAARTMVLSAAPPTQALPEPASDVAPATPHGRVLVVHDSPEIGDLLSIAFDREGFESAVCRDGLEAVEVLAEDPVVWNAVVTSADTPTLDGSAVLRRAKQLNPAILCVAFADGDRPSPARSDADLYWPRPSDVVALAQRVKVELILRRPG